MIICSLAFFLGNTEGLAQQLAGALITFSTYPMYIFNGAVRVLLFTIIPAGFNLIRSAATVAPVLLAPAGRHVRLHGAHYVGGCGYIPTWAAAV